MSAESILEVDDLWVRFTARTGAVDAVRGISLRARRGERVVIVGESGSGKSATALAVMGLLGNGLVSRGSIRFEGRDLLALRPEEMRRIRGAGIAMIFQDPMTSLHPLFSVGDQVAEVLRWHRELSRRQMKQRVVELLGEVLLPDPERTAAKYPHQLSGGQQQRVMIAMALACSPSLLIADEPTTALDVTVQAEVLDLIRRLGEERGAALLLVTHDMGVVADMADHVLVMYAGRIVEEGTADRILTDPQHPYTKALIAAIPTSSTVRKRPLSTISPELRAELADHTRDRSIA